MTVPEFKNEFLITYDAASKGGPDLNNYEISLFLTQAVRETVEELYAMFEYSEYSKRALAPLISEKELVLQPSTDYMVGIVATRAVLPTDLYFILQENVILKGVSTFVEVISEDLDTINKTVKNPFKKPSDRKILRTQISGTELRLYSNKEITKYKIKFLKQYNPIIISNFASDPDLLGTETIDGKNVITNTNLPVFLHDKIIKRAVILAVKSLRDNNLKTQIEV